MFEQTALIKEMGKLRKFAMRLTHNTSDADDLLQSTVLRALEKKHLFQSDTDLFKWTSKIMFNIFASEYRRKTKFETQYDPENYLDKRSVDASQDVIVDFGRMQEAMDRISQDHKDILVLVCVKGMSYQEVSEMLQIPVGTVRSRLSRARESLQNSLEMPRAVASYTPPQAPQMLGIEFHSQAA